MFVYDKRFNAGIKKKFPRAFAFGNFFICIIVINFYLIIINNYFINK